MVTIGVVLRWASSGVELCIHPNCFLKQRIQFFAWESRVSSGQRSSIVGCVKFAGFDGCEFVGVVAHDGLGCCGFVGAVGRQL